MNRLTPSGARISNRTLRLDAAGVTDGRGVSSTPGTLIIENDDASTRVLFAGHPGDADRHPASSGAVRISLPSKVLTPAFVNAHTHLDLTHVGPRPHSSADGFVSWIRMVIRERATSPEAIRGSVRAGIAKSLAGGVAGVGDICGGGSLVPLEEHRGEAVGGVCYSEVFGIGKDDAGGATRAGDIVARATSERSRSAMREGLSPHAPYSAGRGAFGKSRGEGLYVCTHVAESIEERELIREGTGPFRAFLESFGVWDDSLLEYFGRGAHPVDLALDMIEPGGGARWMFAHVNDCEDAHLSRLAQREIAVAYCPRGHVYFGHTPRLGAHRWREMVEAGVNVCLGTDSVINLPPGAGSDRISPLDEARHLWSAGCREAALLLRMITSNPARALGLSSSHDFEGGAVGGIIGVEVREMGRDERAEEAVIGRGGGVSWVSRGAWLDPRLVETGSP